MASLKELRNRINSVKSTQKITSAMKMVAASKLRRAQEAAEEARPYAERMERMVGALAATVLGAPGAPPLLVGNGRDQTHLIVVVTSDRGLCGGFNGNIVRDVRKQVRDLREAGKTVKMITIGRKGHEVLKREMGDFIVETYDSVAGQKGVTYEEARDIGGRIRELFDHEAFDVCTVVYNRFKSAMTQVVTHQQLIPFALPDTVETGVGTGAGRAGAAQAVYEYEPSQDGILAELLPQNLSVQVYRALLESYASEQGARMTAMDNATRNAGEMIDDLTLTYNRQRQANITKELNEIISGAEAV